MFIKTFVVVVRKRLVEEKVQLIFHWLRKNCDIRSGPRTVQRRVLPDDGFVISLIALSAVLCLITQILRALIYNLHKQWR